MGKTDLVAVKHNALVTGKYNLSLVEQRVMLSIIGKIDSTGEWDGTDGRYTINFEEVLDFIETKHDSKRLQMMEATDNLLSKVVHIKLRDMDDDLMEKYKKVKLEKGDRPLDFERDEIQTNWVLPPVRYTLGLDELPIKIDKFLMPFLIEIKKNFTKISLEEALKLKKSKYSLRCFEIISRYEHRGKVEIPYQELREMLGIEEKAYQRFTNFRDRVLNVAVDDILENTNLKFEVTINKRWREVASITFDKIRKTKKKTSKMVVMEKQETTTGEDFYEMLKPEWEKELNKRGVVVHKKYEKEGLTQEHWEKAMLKTDISDAQIVIEAKKIMSQEKEQEIEARNKKKRDEILSTNSKWWDQNSTLYPEVSGSIPYLTPPKGKPILFIDPNFRDLLSPFRITEEEEERRKTARRKTKSLIGGTSQGRKGKGRRATD